MLVAGLLPVAATAMAGGPVPGQPIEAIDGDTLIVGMRRFHLTGIDAPEVGQRCRLNERLYDCGEVARTTLLELASGGALVCEAQSGSADPEEGEPGRCSAGDRDLAESLVHSGWAVAEPRSGERYRSAQASAKDQKRGLWRGHFLEPWRWRQGERLPGEADVR